MNRGSVCRDESTEFLFFYNLLMLAALGVALSGATGCQKESTPLTASEIRDVTREFAFAAHNASNGRAEVGMHPEYARRRSGSPQDLIADDIYITLPLKPTGLPDQAVHDAIEKESARVAEFPSSAARVEAWSAGPGASLITSRRGEGPSRFILSLPMLTTASRPHQLRSFGTGPFYIHTMANRPQPRHCDLLIWVMIAHRRTRWRVQDSPTCWTLSVLWHPCPVPGEIAEEAHRRGYQVMLHLPMASNAGEKDEPVELHPGI